MKKFESTYDRITRESRAEGKAEGRTLTLLRQMHRRFGPLPAAVERRVRESRREDLDRWTDRILDATTLADLFAD